MKKQPEVTKKTRQAFITIFCELYSQKPIEKIAIQEIANKSGYNRSTFYQYFSDVYELLDSVENEMLDMIKEAFSNTNASGQPINDAFQCFEEESHILILRALLGDYGGTRFLERLKREVPFDKLKLNLPKEDALTPYLIEFYLSTLLSLFRLWILRRKDLSPEQLVQLGEGLYARGVASIVESN